MPDLLVSAATGALSPVLHKLAALLGDEYKRFKGVRGEVKFLIRELEAMHAFLLKKSEEEDPDVQDKVWMKEVRELSYDIEDSLDDFRVRVDDESTKPDGFIDKCKNLLKKTKARHQIAKAIQDLKVQVKEVSERNARYKQTGETVMNTSKVMVDPRALAIFEDASRLVGIDQPKEEIISFLKEEDGGTSSQQPKIVSIVGIGGIGKTTLANRVYQELKDQFRYRAFLSVSRNPDMVMILRTIRSKVMGQPYYKTEEGSIQQLIIKINEFLQAKRYFIVVDDIWDTKTWDTIKFALTNNSCGSVIITTTRIHDVAEACCSLYSDGWVYKPKPLQEQDSERLFQNRIFGIGKECPENLKAISNKILKKCGGLPLAIIAISGLLANKARNGVHSLTEWDLVQTSIGRGLERDSTVEGMMRILSLSYFDLPHHLKACLLYLSIFPEDYEIYKEDLVRLWVAEGFIPAKSTSTLYESGEESFNELVNRNLILPVLYRKWTGELVKCRVHDTILDFIVCKSTEDNFVTVHGTARLTTPPRMKVRRVSLQCKTEADVTLHSNWNYANVRSIVSFRFPCSLSGLRFLRVLDFKGCRVLLENHHLANIGELLQLRFLSLRETRITKLPEQIGALQYLETLDVQGCNIIQLPTAIVQLKRLVNLLMGPQKLKCFPRGIKNMQALELNSVAIDIKAAAIFVEEIGDLTKMRHLGILFFTNSGHFDKESYMDLIKKMVSSFQRLNKLRTLDVQFNNHFEAGLGHGVIDGDDVILEVPWCSASLRKLVFKMNTMSRVPNWMKSLVNIEELELRIKKLDQESHYILGDLPFLVGLTLELGNNFEDIPLTDKQQLLISNRYGYRSLRHFSISMPSPMPINARGSGLHRSPSIPMLALLVRTSIPMLTFEAGSMPKLEELDIDFNADVTISVSNGRLDFGLKYLSELMEVRCYIFGTELNIRHVKTAIEEALDSHPKLPYFSVNGVPEHWPSHLSSTEGERSNRERLSPHRCSQLTVHTTQPKPVQKRRRLETHQGATIRVRELVEGAPLIADRVEGTSGAATATSAVLEPRLVAAPQQQEIFTPSSFTFGSGSPSNTEDLANAFASTFNGLSLRDEHPGSSAIAVEAASSHTGDDKMSSSTTNDNNRQSLTASLPIPTDLSTIHHRGASPEPGRRHGQRQHRSEAHRSSIHGREVVQGAVYIPDSIKGTSGAAPATSAVLEARLIAAPQHQEAFAPPCFTFGSGSPPNTEDLANAFTSTFSGLSLRDDHCGSSATAVETASSDTGNC